MLAPTVWKRVEESGLPEHERDEQEGEDTGAQVQNP
jgi:hypothetical protein